MTRLILTTNVATSRDLEESGRADIAIPLMPRFVWGALSTDTELAAIFAPRTTQSPGSHWLDYAFPLAKKMFGRDIGLIELCQCCEAVELWMETEPNGQLVLVWLLDYLHSHANATIGSNLILCHVDANLGGALPTELVKWRFRAVGITERSSGNRKSRVEGIPRANAAGMVQLAREGLKCPAATPTVRSRIARRTSRARNRAWCLRNAALGIDLRRLLASVRPPPSLQAAFPAPRVRRIGGLRPFGGVGACAGARHLRARGVAGHDRNGRPP
jgi:hypothetical protein